MKKYLILLYCIANLIQAQDERDIRKLLTPKVTTQKEPRWESYSDHYSVDLDGNGKTEYVQTAKIDNLDYIIIKDEFGNSLFKQLLLARGVKSNIFRIKKVNINSLYSALVILFFEGKTEAAVFEATSKMYFISYKKDNLKKFIFSEGTHFQHEKEKVSDQYWYRHFDINIFDYNRDGNVEVSILFNKIAKIYFFNEEQLKWYRL
ncbi:hypothetical protein N9N67_03435 [Bacteriovoracaceae bacterium]|nr:hypothetical protein [Bacteriovoracaceae bacterium]